MIENAFRPVSEARARGIVAGRAKVHSTQPLKDGNVLVLECGTKRIQEVNRAGETVKEVPLSPKPGVGTHGQFRSARKLATGNYVVSFLSEGKVAKIDPSGKVIREQKVPGQPHEIVPLKNGNWLVTCGDGHRVMEFTPQGAVAWELAENELPDNPLRWMAGAQRLPNGNTLLRNWLGHGNIGKNPHIYEVPRTKSSSGRLPTTPCSRRSAKSKCSTTTSWLRLGKCSADYSVRDSSGPRSGLDLH